MSAKRIPIAQLNFDIPNFKESPKGSTSSKDKIILEWLCNWISEGFKTGALTSGDFLPPKAEIAQLLGVSAATVQNAIRYAEDLGHVQSKQRVGTCVLDVCKKGEEGTEGEKFQKSYSKKDDAKNEIKNLIVELGLDVGAKLPSSRVIAQSIETSHNTVRLALTTLVSDGILVQKFYRQREKSWFLNSEIITGAKEKKLYEPKRVANKTLCKKLENEIKNYIINNFKIGDKIPTNAQMASIFKVSLKTVNDCLKNLQKNGLIIPRRGQYGTIFVGKHIGAEKNEKSIFMTPHKKEVQSQNFQYAWEKTMAQIKKHIEKKYELGDKIPSIKEFATLFSTSTNTVRHAIKELCASGILHTQRGKFGGTYIAQMPDETPSTYSWLALNPKQ